MEENYLRLQRAAQALRSAHGSGGGVPVFRINELDRWDLIRFNVTFLQEMGFEESLSEGITAALSNGDLTALGNALGVRFELDDAVPSIFGN